MDGDGFLLMLDMWWGTWGREAYLTINILYFFLSLVVPILFYFFSSVLFPIELLHRGYDQLRHYYLRNNKAFCVFFGLILFSNAVVANVMEETIFWSTEYTKNPKCSRLNCEQQKLLRSYFRDFRVFRGLQLLSKRFSLRW